MNEEIDVHELKEKLEKDPGTVLIDVREEDEFNDVNLAGKLIPMSELEDRYAEIPKDVPVYLYCRSGNRSRWACRFLESKGYGNCVNVAGGILAWQNEIDPEGRQAG